MTVFAGFGQEMTERSRAFALRVYRLCRSLPRNPEAYHMRDQLFRCATSVAANYRAALRAKSDRDYLSKLKICEEDSDESGFWMEMLVACNLVPMNKIESVDTRVWRVDCNYYGVLYFEASQYAKIWRA